MAVAIGDYILINDKVYKVETDGVNVQYKENEWTITESDDTVEIDENNEIEHEVKYLVAIRFFDKIKINETDTYDTPIQDQIDEYDAQMANFTNEQSIKDINKENLTKYGLSIEDFGNFMYFFIESDEIHIKTTDKTINESEYEILKYKDRFANWYESPWEDGGIYYVFRT